MSCACTQRSMLMSDTYGVACKSNTFNENNNENDLHLHKKHINDDDKILIIDYFLSSGAKKEALTRSLKLTSNDVNIIGIGMLIEKLHVCGRQHLTREPRMGLANSILIKFQKLVFKTLSYFKLNNFCVFLVFKKS